jgi:hypothetical protein
VAAGYRADGVGHYQQREAERKGDPQIADMSAGEDGGAAAAEHEHKCAHHFGDEHL